MKGRTTKNEHESNQKKRFRYGNECVLRNLLDLLHCSHYIVYCATVRFVRRYGNKTDSVETKAMGAHTSYTLQYSPNLNFYAVAQRTVT